MPPVIRTLRDICAAVEYGYTASAAHDIDGPQFLRITDIVPNLIDWSNVPRCQIESKKLPKFQLRHNDIVIARTGATVGYAKRLKNPPLSVFASYLVRLKIDESVADPAYVGAVVESAEYKDFVVRNAGGAAQPNANAQVLSSYEIPFPDLPTQRRIAAILSAYDDLIENNTRRIAILEEMARRIYEEWFVRFRFPGHEKVRMVESELGLVPEGWGQSVGSLLESSLGGDWGSDSPNKDDTEVVRVVRGTDFDDCVTGSPLRVPIRYITKSSLSKRRLLVGDVVVENSINAKSRTSGKTLLVTDGLLRRLGGEAIAASFCKVFRLKDKAISALLHQKMKSQYEAGEMAFFQNVAANGIANFQATRYLEKSQLLVPTSGDLAKRACEVFQSLHSSVFADKNHNLRTTRDLLLPKLISGELDVSHLPELEAMAA
jgi:type I restriction enzyme S subunit